MDKIAIKLPNGCVKYISEILATDAATTMYETSALPWTVENYLALEQILLIQMKPFDIVRA